MDVGMAILSFLLESVLGVDISRGFSAEVAWAAAHIILGLFGAILSTVGYVWPCFTTMVDIKHAQSVGNRSAVPYAAAVINCFMWFGYGLAKGSSLILLVNLIGFAAQVYCFVIFLYYSEEYDRQRWLVYFFGGVFPVGGIILFFASDLKRNLPFFCWACAIWRCVPPIAAFHNLRVAYRDDNMNAMPSVVYCGISLASAIFWGAYACTGPKLDGHGLEIDGFVLGPSLVGVVSAALLLLLHFGGLRVLQLLVQFLVTLRRSGGRSRVPLLVLA